MGGGGGREGVERREGGLEGGGGRGDEREEEGGGRMERGGGRGEEKDVVDSSSKHTA